MTLGSGFYNPAGVAVDNVGNVNMADYSNNAVKQIKTDGSIETLGQIGVNGFNGFLGPLNVAMDAAANVYVTDFYNKIYKIDKNSGVVSSFQPFSKVIQYFAVSASGNVCFALGNDISID